MNDLHYAVIVGINRYPAITDLSGARGDAARFRDWLLDSAGGDVPEGNVALVTATERDEREADVMSAVPTRENVNRALYRTHCAVRAAVADGGDWADTRLYVFLAGHGIAPFGGDAALLMANAAIDLLGNHIAVRPYLSWYESASPFHEIVFFADCCRTRFGGVTAFGPPFTDTTEAPDKVECFVGYGSALGDPAYEQLSPDPDQSRGHFTSALLEGLRGAGGGTVTAEGEVTSDSLAHYVRRHVLDRTAGELVPQEARFLRETSTPIVFGRGLGGVGSYPETLRFPPGFRGGVELRGRGFDEPRRLDIDGADHVASLVPGLYKVVADSLTAPEFTDGGFFEVVTGGGSVVQF
ncbi:caspase family protein [Streptomyces alboflavus]|uniref:caspase family protein n=1 Tax=Streptomyces alboflavus TaxID=67267 RepID=UPI000F658CEC|nr:caspase family protein [Streptomyces alboflavus]